MNNAFCGIHALCVYAAIMFYRLPIMKAAVSAMNTAALFAGGSKNVVFAYVLFYQVFDNDACHSLNKLSIGIISSAELPLFAVSTLSLSAIKRIL